MEYCRKIHRRRRRRMVVVGYNYIKGSYYKSQKVVGKMLHCRAAAAVAAAYTRKELSGFRRRWGEGSMDMGKAGRTLLWREE